MIKKIIRRIDNYILRKVISYKISDEVFVKYWNFRLKLNKLKIKFALNVRDLNTPRYQIIDAELNKAKYFAYRGQGIYAFADGIFKRGEKIGADYLLDQISFNNGDFVFDIGANTGDLKIYFDNRNINVNYFGFEPGIEEYKALKLNNSGCHLFNFALGNNDTKKTFYYKPETGDSSLIEMNNFEGSYEVEVKKISSVIENEGLNEAVIKLIKLEAEGFEPEILQGLGKYIKNVQFISADLGFERGIAQETTAPEVINYLLGSGFEIMNITNGRICVLFKNKNFKSS